MNRYLKIVTLLIVCLLLAACGYEVDVFMNTSTNIPIDVLTEVPTEEENRKDEETLNEKNEVEEEKAPIDQDVLPINNGSKVVKYRNLIYFIKPNLNYNNKEEPGALMVINEDGSNASTLYPNGGDKIYILGDYLYASFPNETGGYYNEDGMNMTTYRISLDGEEILPLFEGSIVCLDSKERAIYLIHNDLEKSGKNGLYKMTLDDLNEIKLYNGNCFYLGVDGDVIYFWNSEKEEFDKATTFLYSIKTDGTKLTLIDEDSVGTRYGKYITCFGIDNNRIIYCTGRFVMANGFVAKFISIKKDGTGKKQIEETSAHFTIIDGWVYYGLRNDESYVDSELYPQEPNWIEPEGRYSIDSGGYYKALPDLSEVQSIETDKMPICNYRRMDNDYYYFFADFDAGDGLVLEVPIINIYKSKWDGSDKETLVKNSDLFEWDKAVSFNSSIFEIVDGWLYFDMEVSLSENRYDKDFIESKFCRMRLDGSDLKVLSIAY